MGKIKVKFILESGEIVILETAHEFESPDDAHNFDIESFWTNLIGEAEDLLATCDMCFRSKCSCDNDVDNSRDN